MIELDSLVSEQYLNKLYKCGAPCVDCLIELIDIDAKGEIYPINPLRSTLFQYEINNFLGIRAVVALESVFGPLGKDQFSNTDYRYPELLPVSRQDIQYPFDYHRALTFEDMAELKALYSTWWNQNRLVPLDSIRKDHDLSEIVGNKYFWVKSIFH